MDEGKGLESFIKSADTSLITTESSLIEEKGALHMDFTIFSEIMMWIITEKCFEHIILRFSPQNNVVVVFLCVNYR